MPVGDRRCAQAHITPYKPIGAVWCGMKSEYVPVGRWPCGRTADPEVASQKPILAR
jgi:hypothetical protein